MAFLDVLKRVRRLWFRPRGVKMGEGSLVLRPFRVENPSRIQMGRFSRVGPQAYLSALVSYAGVEHSPEIVIGDHVYIGSNVFIGAMNRVEIGDRCVLSDHIYLNDSSHGFEMNGTLIMEQPLESKGPIIIGHDCFLGYRSAVLPGVTLGEHCIVGIHSVVTKSFPPYSVIGGVPAKLIKTREVGETAG